MDPTRLLAWDQAGLALVHAARAPWLDSLFVVLTWFGSLAVLQGRVDYIDRPLVQYRRHGGNVSPSRRQSIGQMLRWRWNLLRNVARRRRAVRARSAVGPAA